MSEFACVCGGLCGKGLGAPLPRLLEGGLPFARETSIALRSRSAQLVGGLATVAEAQRSEEEEEEVVVVVLL